MNKPLFLYEINEVPWRVVDLYTKHRPHSNLAKALDCSKTYTTVTKDIGELHPWSTWPTLHRGVYNSDHNILFLNQDKSAANQWPPIWEILAARGIQVGVFGSLQSFPIPNYPFSFYIPDTFSPSPDTVPSRYSAFQRVNLRQTKADGAMASDVNISGSVVFDLAKMCTTGLKPRTISRLAIQLLKEKQNPLYRTRRAILQAPVAFDMFKHALRKHPPEFCTFFSNHVAGIMHRYWKYSFPEDFNFALESKRDYFHRDTLLYAMDIADEQIGYLMKYINKRNGTLLIASSMGQEAVDRGEYFGEVRITDVFKFAKAIGFNKPFKDHLAMQPDFNFEFQSEQDRDEFLTLAERCEDLLGQCIFKRIRSENNTVNLGLDECPNVIQNDKFQVRHPNGSATPLTLSEAGISKIYRDVGTGYHQPKGILICYGKKETPSDLREEIESIEVPKMIINHFQPSL